MTLLWCMSLVQLLFSMTSSSALAQDSGDSGVAAVAPTVDMSRDEAEVYDRQIRLWGLEAQNKLRVSHVLICGLSGLGSEVVKNLMLCGLKSVTLLDDKHVTADDQLSNFLLAENSIGQNRASASAAKARALNPMVTFSVEERSIEEKTELEVSAYSMLILIDQPYAVVDKWDKLCRQNSVRFIAGSVYGWTGYSFFDFNNHLFLMKQPKMASIVGLEAPGEESTSTLEEDVFEKKALSYPSFHDAMNVEWKSKKLLKRSKRFVPTSYFPVRAMMRAEQDKQLTGDEDSDLERFTHLYKAEVEKCNHSIDAQTLNPEQFDYFFGPQLSPVCATVGGIIGQEAIKALSESECPLRNIFIYSALETTGTVVNFPPQ